MQIKVNSEIRDIESELAFGLSVRKLVSVILIFLVVVSANIVLTRKISPDVASPVSLLLGGINGIRCTLSRPYCIGCTHFSARNSLCSGAQMFTTARYRRCARPE